MTKRKVVDLEKLYNFIVNNFFIWNHLSKESYIWISHIWNSKFSNDLHGEASKMIVVNLKMSYNFIVDNPFIWNHLSKRNYVWISHIWNLISSNDIRWRNYQNQSCTPRKVIKLYSWQLFHLNSFMIPNAYWKSDQDKMRTNISK